MGKSSIKKEKLIRELNYEIERLKGLVPVIRKLIELTDEEKRPWDAVAAAKYISDFWMGFESLWKCRLRYHDESSPDGSESHAKVLNDLISEPELGTILTEDEILTLKKYLRFRHRFIHGYGNEISWELVEEPLKLLPITITLVERIWNNWIDKQFPSEQ